MSIEKRKKREKIGKKKLSVYELWESLGVFCRTNVDSVDEIVDKYVELLLMNCGMVTFLWYILVVLSVRRVLDVIDKW